MTEKRRLYAEPVGFATAADGTPVAQVRLVMADDDPPLTVRAHERVVVRDGPDGLYMAVVPEDEAGEQD